jgi:hypothetical protein
MLSNPLIFTKEHIMLGGLLGGGGGLGGIGGMLGGMMGGPLGAMVGDMISKMLSQVMQGVIEQVAKELKLPDAQKDLAQAAVASAFGDKEGVQKNIKELLQDFQKQTGASDSDMGNVERETKNLEELFKKLFNEANNEEAQRNNGDKKKNGNKTGGSGGAGGGAEGAGGAGGAEGAQGTGNAPSPGNDGQTVEGAVDWFTKIAYALAKGAQQQADKVASKSDALTAAMDKSAANPDDKKAANEQMKLQTELQAESSKLGFLMTALNATINALGEAMKTAAQVK